MAQSSSSLRLTRRKADLHEGLTLRLVPLLRQVESIALRNPRSEVPNEIRALAEAALFDARMFRSHARREKMPAAAPHYGALAAQLAAILAELVDFENRQTQWDSQLGAFVWPITGGSLSVRRLRPQVDHKPEAAEDAEQQQLSALLERRINAITKGLDDVPVLARTYPPRPLPAQTYPRGPRLR